MSGCVLMRLKKYGSECYLSNSCNSIGIVFPVEWIGLLRNIESIASSPVSIRKEHRIPVRLWMYLQSLSKLVWRENFAGRNGFVKGRKPTAGVHVCDKSRHEEQENTIETFHSITLSSSLNTVKLLPKRLKINSINPKYSHFDWLKKLIFFFFFNEDDNKQHKGKNSAL